MALEKVSATRVFGGSQETWRHQSSATDTPMEFSIFLPPQTGPRPLVVWLSGLTCTWENATTKAGFQRVAAELGLAVLCPDTSPRGLDLPGEHEAYDFGSGAGFYLDASQSPWDKHYRMASYVAEELLELVAGAFAIDAKCLSIMGHSMGGHGALTIALRQEQRFKAVSAFAPITSPMRCPWGQKALSRYLGEETALWRAYDSTALIEDGARVAAILVDQGTADTFLAEQLRPDLLEKACGDAGIPLTLRRQEGYDHSYYFIATFIEDHLRWHAERLR